MRGLAERGHDVILMAPRRSPLARIALPAGITRDPFSSCRPAAAWQIRSALRRFRPQVLYWNDPKAALLGTAASLGLKAVRVATKRTVFPLRSAILYRRFCDVVICASAAAIRVCQNAGLPPERLQLVHDGVSLERIKQANPLRGLPALRGLLPRAADSPNAVYLITVGKLTPSKGHSFLIEAFRSVAAERANAFLVIVGDGELRESLAARITDAGLADRVALAGFREDVPDLLAAADLFVFPSLAEGLGSSVIDAMLLGLPVVASNVGGIPEILAPPGMKSGEVLGWLVPPGDSSSLAAAMAAALDLPEERRSRLAAIGKNAAERHFAADRMVERTLSVFYQLLGPRKPQA
ncbi:MAG: glycosyltransferase [Thermogutta sp.]|nr:glycosyltransferase [Thermogutta sp.]